MIIMGPYMSEIADKYPNGPKRDCGKGIIACSPTLRTADIDQSPIASQGN